ncbi:Uncharacterised protein [Mycoplasma putrefaciens]|uniref:Uncharacterized protein n=1 Tax=Mycoplasma putrefaciens (strain ATCC 15718 / NCTC 10155 / C30 KS-1 / KS-1) TaxID=743965 RepID=A0A7U3ZSR6_MYCPK|nr:hypothetical protein [Mycoplasma putrefaciens]AEM68852.1 uncharacterized protein MPUT_0486 [Mycoplasma putrefaciens KS1]SYV96185.1 Uncharacterised protein [Mycoplasma putrefaciens]
MKICKSLKQMFMKLFSRQPKQIAFKNKKKTKKQTNKSLNDNSNNFDILNLSEYINKRAELDSEKEFKLKVIDQKQEVLSRLIDINNTYKQCDACKAIYQKNLDSMKTKLSKLNKYVDDNFGFLNDPKEYKQYVFADNNKVYSSIDDQAAYDLIKFLEQHLKSYTEYKVGYFNGCKNHTNLAKECEILTKKVKDLDKLID